MSDHGHHAPKSHAPKAHSSSSGEDDVIAKGAINGAVGALGFAICGLVSAIFQGKH